MGVGKVMCVATASVAVLLAPVRASAGAGLEGVPGLAHVGVLVLENEAFTSTWGAGSPATYLNSLRSQGAFADQYYGIGHVSLDNYVAMTSGQPDQPASGTDCSVVNLYTCAQAQQAMDSGRNIADQIEDAGLTWKAYEDSMPSPCFHADASPAAGPDPYQGDSTQPPAGNYADRHNPFIYYDDILMNDTRCKAHDVPYAQLGSDLSADALPAYFFITPDTCHDGHDSPCAGGEPGGLVTADAWLQQHLPPLLAYLTSHDGLLLITFDESTPSDVSGCCTGGPGGTHGFGGRVGLLALGSGITPGLVTHAQYDHASLLRTTEDALGISEHLNNAATADPMTTLFAGPPQAVPEAPLAPLLAGAAAVTAGLVWRRRRKSA